MKNASIAVILMSGLTLVGAARRVEAQVDPCALLTIAEVQQALPGSKPGSIDRGLEKQGIVRCSWASPDGRLFLVASREPEDSAKDEASGWVSSFVDPLRADAEKRVRFDVIPAIGDQAVAVVERQDKANGIVQDAALIVIRRGTWQVSLLAPPLARRERADALRALGELGKAVVRRLPAG